MENKIYSNSHNIICRKPAIMYVKFRRRLIFVRKLRSYSVFHNSKEEQ